MPWELGALAGWTAIAAGSAFTTQAPVGSAAALALFIAASTAGMLVGAVQLMKLQNRRAQRRIAAGESQAFAALSSETVSESETIITQGLRSKGNSSLAGPRAE